MPVYKVQVSIPKDEEDAQDLYQNAPAFHYLVNEWSEAAGHSVPMILKRQEGPTFSVPYSVFAGTGTIDIEVFNQATQGLPINLVETDKRPDEIHDEYYEKYYTDDEDGEDVYGSPNIEEIYTRVCELKNIIEQQWDMMEKRS